MDTEFVFLGQLEQDLAESARVERRRMTEKARTRRSHRRTWIGAAASFLVIAFAIGFLAQGGTVRRLSSAGGSFSTVGNAVEHRVADQLRSAGRQPKAFRHPTLPATTRRAFVIRRATATASTPSPRIFRRSFGTVRWRSRSPTGALRSRSGMCSRSPARTAGPCCRPPRGRGQRHVHAADPGRQLRQGDGAARHARHGRFLGDPRAGRHRRVRRREGPRESTRRAEACCTG